MYTSRDKRTKSHTLKYERNWIFNQKTSVYMHNPESILENYTYKIPWNSDKQTESQPDDVVIVNKNRELDELWT